MIPFSDPHALYTKNKKSIDAAIQQVLDGKIYILGKQVTEFEKEFAKFVGVPYAVGVASGTDAITIALKAIGIQPGDKVIMPANSYPSVFGVVAAGAIPQLVDCNPDDYTIDVSKIEQAIDKKTKAILPVHLYGQAANLSAILAIAKKHKLRVIEDCAQAHGAQFKGKNVGTFGDIGCFSFYPTKNLGCFGDGGMVVTKSKSLNEKLHLLRMYGEKTRYNSVLVGLNSRLDELQAAILRVKLKHLDQENKQRGLLAKRYITQLQNVKHITLPKIDPQRKHIFHLFVIETPKRKQLMEMLQKNGIMTAIHYPRPIHLNASFAYLKYKKGSFPVTERLADRIVSLPMYSELPIKDLDIVCQNIIQFFNG